MLSNSSNLGICLKAGAGWGLHKCTGYKWNEEQLESLEFAGAVLHLHPTSSVQWNSTLCVGSSKE